MGNGIGGPGHGGVLMMPGSREMFVFTPGLADEQVPVVELPLGKVVVHHWSQGGHGQGDQDQDGSDEPPATFNQDGSIVATG